MKDIGYSALWRQPKEGLHSLQGQSYYSSKQRTTEVAPGTCSLMRSGAVEEYPAQILVHPLPLSGFRGLGLFFRVAPNSAFLPQTKTSSPTHI